MALSKNPYRGTRDFFPAQKREQDFIFKKWAQVAEQFGYEHYDGPLLEEVDLYRAKSGEEIINEQIYSFTDRGERFVAIRPEMTPTLARMVAQVHQEIPKPIRWYSIPNVLRYEKPQRGRLREHWQLNVDIFGAPGNLGEIEIIQMVIHLFQSFGAKPTDFQIHLNDRQLVDGIFSKLIKATDDQIHRLYKIVDRAKKESPEKIAQLVSAVDLNKEQEDLFQQYLKLGKFEQVINFLTSNGLADLSIRWQKFVNKLNDLDLTSYCIYDPAVVRGLDYYTGIVFEAFDLHPENRRALCGGGAYENLLKIFDGPALPAVGFGLGDVTMTDFLKVHNLMPNLATPRIDGLMIYTEEECEDYAIKCAQKIRLHGAHIAVQFGPQKLKKGFEQAEKRGADYIIFVGKQEMDEGKVSIRNMKSREQKVLLLDDIINSQNWPRI